MTKLQNFFQTIFKIQTVQPFLFTILLAALCTPLFAQTVNTVGTGVYYTNGVKYGPNIDESPAGSLLYCNGNPTNGSSPWKNTDVVFERSFGF